MNMSMKEVSALFFPLDKECFICKSTESQAEIRLLPCKQCNDLQIENKKYIHEECLIRCIENSGYNSDSDDDFSSKFYINCPHCRSGKLENISFKTDYIKTLKVMLGQRHILQNIMDIVILITALIVNSYYSIFLELPSMLEFEYICRYSVFAILSVAEFILYNGGISLYKGIARFIYDFRYCAEQKIFISS